MKKTILFVLLVSFLSYLAVGQTLQFALNGDDWLALWRYIKDFTSFKAYFDISNYTNTYSSYAFADILTGLIYKVFQFNPFPYYLFSMILRIVAALSFYPAVLSASKNKLAAFLSAVFFASMFAGIETTNWVFNMNTYISIALFNSFIYLYLKNTFKAISLKTVLLGLLLLLTFSSAPTRMHGLLFIIPFITLLKINKFTKKEIINSATASIILYLPILCARLLLMATKDKDFLGPFSQILSYTGNPLAKLLKTLSNLAIPDRTLISFVSDDTKALTTLILYAFLIILFLKTWKKSPAFAKFGLFVSILPILFLLIPWLIAPGQVLPSEHRYLTAPASYFFVALALLCAFLWQQKNQILKGIAFVLPIVIITVNIFTLRQYLNLFAQEGRLTTDVNKQFKILEEEVQNINPDAPAAFLFIPDDPAYLYNAITFGFTSHMMLTHPKFGMDFQKSPFPADNWDSLINVLSNENSPELHRYGYNPVKIPLENVYIFKLENKTLTNITDTAREELKKKLPDLK